MSGGRFDYQQYTMNDIADKIEEYVNGETFYDDTDVDYTLNELKEQINRWNDPNDVDEYNYIKEHRHGVPNRYGFSEETINEFKTGIKLLQRARIYADRIDWLLSGDDGEEEFHKRLKEELEELNNEKLQ